MGRTAALPAPANGMVDPTAILSALPEPILVIDRQRRIHFANLQAEEFFDASAALLVGSQLDTLIPGDSPVHSLIDQARMTGGSVSDYSIMLETPRIGLHFLTAKAAPLSDPPDLVVLSLHERSIARKIDNQLTHRGAARSVVAMAAMLAHEVKNPLSGIRGAAQLLEENASEGDRMLTRLICDEADRIVALVDRMEVFTDGRPLEKTAVNIHGVLEHVRRVAQSGFGRTIRFVERYDPSLPPVLGNRDQLIQVFLNLVKNAAEACPEKGGEIVLSTAYQHGVRLAVPGSDSRVHLPLLISVQDNGDGIPEDLRANLFDPFVTTKMNGTGLGLALVAKIIGDHGGVIDFDSVPRRTIFKVSLPVAPGRTASEGGV
ncbi:two-component system nitrogen regulation sensor histidine kinase GlnL [Nitrospirillum amazonense]|uniref:histidine kinase n=1 Tax=Nitrospirillum amazonense TaxID=28077 RepID=A0A560F6K5_9PROT|nr:ATP-binding protein [Nitrospirillum amazonense]TWB17252.1 two-component system nitrogen regulation sensor histidine kinase GlnL [Nitrospirillum amazonense]